MALSTLERFRLVASEFSARPDSEVNDFIEMATERIDVAVFGDDYQQALAYLAAHMMAIADKNTGNSPGPVVSERAGEISRTYGYSQAVGNYKATTYGQEFIAIRRSRAGTHVLNADQDLGLT